LFGEYELLEASRLFDPNFYRSAYPDVAAMNMDPLLHYLERGCRERRDPGPEFDTAHYLEQCALLGETPQNALTHYLTEGINRGLTPVPAAAAALYVDIPRLVGGAAETPVHGGLSIVGWGLTGGGRGSVEIALDGVRVTSARCGLRRPDVVAAHPGREGALLSGYAAHLPAKVLAVGPHRITVTLLADGQTVRRVDFQIDVQQAADTRGPWSLRRKMSQAEVDLKFDSITALGTPPRFSVALKPASGAAQRDGVRRTLESLRRQRYAHWRLRRPARRATRSDSSESSRGAVDATADAWTDVSTDASAKGERRFVLSLAAGDELGSDALLEFALAIGRHPRADFFYCDERRVSPADARVEAWFKPGWSPDLLLSTNYIGRAWCADERLLRRAGLAPAMLAHVSDYAVVLKLTEAAAQIQHVPAVLCERGVLVADSAADEHRALVDALARRKLEGDVHGAGVTGHYRVRRALKRAHDRVSIIIPTCAAAGLVKTCIESLRTRTGYRDYEVIVVENIPAERREMKSWLKGHADKIVHATGTFNWSSYNNQAAAAARGKYLLFLNDDIEVIEGGWLDALLEHAQRSEVGVVGAKLLYPDLSVQHGGVMLDRQGRGRHAFRHLEENDPGYFGLASTVRNVISVTGACLMTRRETFDALGRFAVEHAVINNDLDYCLRASAQGLLNVYTPHARLIHHELVSRSGLPEHYAADKFARAWSRTVAAGDPYFNPNLARDDESFAIEREPVETVYAGHPLYPFDAVQRILVVKLDHIGDCVTALPALRRLKEHFPAAMITVLAARATLPIWRQEAAVTDTLEFNFFRARSGAGKHEISAADLAHLGEVLGARGFDLAVDLRKQPDSRFVLEHCGARWLAGFDHQGRFPWLDMALEWDEDVPLRSKHGHVTDDLLALVEMIAAQGRRDRRAIPRVPEGRPALPAAVRRRLGGKPLVCVHPSAGSEMRQWPLRHFTALIDLLLDHEDCHVALIGGGDEAEAGLAVRKGSRHRAKLVDLTGALALDELMKLLATAAVFVGNNSGPQHLAAGLGVSTVGIHSGVVDAREWGPLGPRAVALRRDMSCSPCYLERAADCPRQLACLEQLPVAAVYSQCRQMLAAAVS
jgi:ADP-heptose:LPS heptosyltransferase/GT2 family glycosyltransferase